MSDEGPRASPRPTAASRRTTTITDPTRKVAGGRHNPSVAGIQPTAPRWLMVAAGWSWRLLVVVLAVALVFWATSRVQLLFIAVFVALVFTAVLRPLTNLYNRVMPRALATALTLLTGLAVIGGMVTYVAVSVAGQWKNLEGQFNTGVDRISTFLEDGPLPIDVTAGDVDTWIANGRAWLTTHSGEIASTAFAQVSSVAEIFAVFALAVFLTVFFLARGGHMWTWFLNQLPADLRQTWHTAGGIGWYTFSGYARGTVIIALTDGILAAIALGILGVPLAAPLAVLVFIGAFIPLIGAPAAMVIAMVVALAANGVWNAVFVGVAIALIGQFEGHVLQPIIMGKQVAVHPVVIALVVTGGTLIGGILGAMISVPLVAVAWAVFARMRGMDPPLEEDELEPFDPDDPNERSSADDIVEDNRLLPG